MASECSTPSGTFCALKSERLSSTAAANGCSPRSAAPRITLIRLGQSTCVARFSCRGRREAEARLVGREKDEAGVVEPAAAGAAEHLQQLIRLTWRSKFPER